MSECGRWYFGFTPEYDAEPLGLWRAWGREHRHSVRTWILAADDHTPYELLEALTAAWAGAHDPFVTLPGSVSGSPRGEDELLTILRAAGWGTDPHAEDGMTRWTSPDGRCVAELRPEGYSASADATRTALHGHPHWKIYATPQPYRRPLWTLTATRDTPTLLLAAFITAMTDSSPLTRYLGHLSPDQRQHVTLTPVTDPAA